ncbi:cytidine deaminase-like protein [Wallemia mellicola]|uniref:Cytidine deaminase-like protein n=1 Tax=Wallemia mellicola TaxID=1708541 RepID=A0AB38MW20_9BASI|nr:cytidine deaminase-like protein [Wallemia mellicola]TIC66442.1 cytidine deaminase-like protein [Wallemia mellicola]
MSDSPSTSLIPVEDLPFDRINDILEPTCLDENGDPYLFTVDAWIVNLTNPIQTRELIRFAIHHRIEDRKCERTKHLRRIRKAYSHQGLDCGPDATNSTLPDSDFCISVFLAEATPELTKDKIKQLLSKTSDQVKDLDPYILKVPARRATTAEEYTACQKYWPVSFTPKAQFVNGFTYDYWHTRKLEWVMEGLEKAKYLALEAQSRGELPIAAHVSSPPEEIPVPPGYPPPTPNMKALGYDTRSTTGNPLNHAIFNCVRQVGELRYRADAETTSNKRTLSISSGLNACQNGAEYLCTSLTLFSTHEPCMMCAMALVHSRVRDIYFLKKSSSSGGCGSVYGVHEMPNLNHHFEAWCLDNNHPLCDGLDLDDHISP